MTADEQIVLDFHPHWKTLFRALLVAAIVIAGEIVAATTLHGQSHYGQIMIAAGVVGALLIIFFAVGPFMRWATTSYVLTNHRFVLRRGIFSREGRDIPLIRVNDVSFKHGLLDRMLGCGTLVVESAGEHGQLVEKAIPHVERVQNTFYRLMEEQGVTGNQRPSGDTRQ